MIRYKVWEEKLIGTQRSLIYQIRNQLSFNTALVKALFFVRMVVQFVRRFQSVDSVNYHVVIS